jgi:hypothetical protein
MFYNCILKNSIVYVPTVAKTEAGFYIDCEPVAVVPIASTGVLRQAFHDVMGRGNVIIPTPKRASYPHPVLLKYAGAKTWSAFARGASQWSIKEKEGNYQIVGYRTHPDGYWVEDSSQKVDFEPGSTVDDVIDRMITILHAAAGR